MTSRERARLILNDQEADRPAIDLGSTIAHSIPNVLPEVPVENVPALYRTAQAFRYH